MEVLVKSDPGISCRHGFDNSEQTIMARAVRYVSYSIFGVPPWLHGPFVISPQAAGVGTQHSPIRVLDIHLMSCNSPSWVPVPDFPDALHFAFPSTVFQTPLSLIAFVFNL